MLDDFIQWARDRGRLGGIVLLLAGLFVGGLTAADYRAHGGFFYFMPVLAGILLVGGVWLLIVGGGKKPTKHTEPPSPELIQQLETRPRPFHFCTRCRLHSPTDYCDNCRSGAFCLHIENEDDIQMAISAMG